MNNIFFGSNKSSGHDIISILKKLGVLSSASDLEKMQKTLAEEAKRLKKKEAVDAEIKELERKAAEAEKARQTKDVFSCTEMELPLDWENAFAHDSRTEGVHADSVSDGLVLSLNNLGRVDIEYISAITDVDCKTVIAELKGSIFQNPETWDTCFYKGWETSEEYLSGNVVRKWRKAKNASREFSGYFDENVAALEAVMPSRVSTDDIYITLGSPWVPTDIIYDFIRHIIPTYSSSCTVAHDDETGSWEIANKNWPAHTVAASVTYGTPKITALHILENTLNMKTVTVRKEVACLTNKSGKKRVVDREETLLAVEKQQKMIAAFQKWVWKDGTRRSRLENIYEEKYGAAVKRVFDGGFLTFPTMNPDMKLYKYQKDAVARILFSKNTLLAHDVGAGKTYIMVAAGMELKRMGLSEKNLFVVPNNLVGQWKDIFLKLYPNANLLTVEPKDFTPQRICGTLLKLVTEDFDGIIMAASCFERIEFSKEHRIATLKEEKRRLSDTAAQYGKKTSNLSRRITALTKRIQELADGDPASLPDSLCFENLGITRLFIDEAHNYKNVPLNSKIDRVLGVSSSGSEKCRDVMEKVHFIQRANGGGGVIFATGTPITNSITDAFVMQKYLQSGELATLDLQSFDGWVGMFAERVTEFEVDVDTGSYRLATRFSKFHNLPELTTLLSFVADFHEVEEAGLPDFDGYSDALIPKTDEFQEYLNDISRRADTVRQGNVKRTEDNMLKITTDGRKAALDMRLVEPTSPFNFFSKVARCAEKVFEIYCRTNSERLTQLVFCDTSTPKVGFNLYDELKRLLVEFGVSESEIAFVHDYSSDAARSRLFAAVRTGKIRVLIGSTFKLGLGVNVQDKLVALHHLDVPWRPADMTQREGRILRQGNGCERVGIYRYIAEGSFDAYSWQLLETKQRFISALLSGSLSQRSGSDIDNTVLDYAEIKALAVGNPLIKERIETANELSRLLTLKRKSEQSLVRMQQELSDLPDIIAGQRRILDGLKADFEFYGENKVEYDKECRKELRERLFTELMEHEFSAEEKEFEKYQGFQIIFPVNMTRKSPYVWLKGATRHRVELGETAVGVLIRIDNYLDSLDAKIARTETEIERLSAKEAALREELANHRDFDGEIERCMQKLDRLDKKLGVDKQ